MRCLGIARNADENEIKRHTENWQRNIIQIQTRGNVQAEEKFKEVTEAYTVLSDKEREHCMIDLDMLPLMGVETRSENGGFSEEKILAEEEVSVDSRATIRNIISRVVIWKTCLRPVRRYVWGWKNEHPRF